VQGDADIIDILNEVLTGELTAVNQYFLDARMLDNWGITHLAKHFYDDSIDEMKDADELIQRILYLEGLPNVQRMGPIRIGETPVEKLRLARDAELEALERLRRGIALCFTRDDHGSRELLEKILHGEEEHTDWHETQLDLVERVGEQLYLAQQLDD
jgi:bacterioferritin